MIGTLPNISILDAINANLDMSAIVDRHGLIVYPNKAFLRELGNLPEGAVIGRRIGDVARCSRFLKSPAGCGKGAGCAFCGVNLAIIRCFILGQAVETEAALVLNEGAAVSGANYRVLVTPLAIGDKPHACVVFRNISAEKARRFIDTHLLHYLIDQISGIHGLSEFLAENLEANKHRDLALTIADSSEGALARIQQYTRLVDAESGAVKAVFGEIRLRDLLQRIEATCASELAVKLVVDCACPEDSILYSDSALLIYAIQFLIGAAKNGSESEREIGLRATLYRKRYWLLIHSHEHLTPASKYQLFSRWGSEETTFRSLEPYLARLYVERYLNGQIGCRSIAGAGTAYYIALPGETSGQLESVA